MKIFKKVIKTENSLDNFQNEQINKENDNK